MALSFVGHSAKIHHTKETPIDPRCLAKKVTLGTWLSLKEKEEEDKNIRPEKSHT